MQLHSYLSKSRHGIFYFRWPLQQNSDNAPRRSVRISLGTRCPKEAGVLSRHLAVCGAELGKHEQQSGMDHAELRAKVHNYFKKQLETGKARMNARGPYSAEERAETERGLKMLEEGNREYWHLLGTENTRTELNAFLSDSGLSRDVLREHTALILDEIRKARIGVHKAALAHSDALGSYDFTKPQSAPVSVPSAPAAEPQGPSLSEAVEAFLRDQKTSGVTTNTINKRSAILEVALEWFGSEKPMSAIDKRAAGDFKAALLTLPSNRMKVQRVRGLSLREAMAVHDVPKISNGTANAYLSALNVFWAWAETHGYADEALFANMAIAKRGHEAMGGACCIGTCATSMLDTNVSAC